MYSTYIDWTFEETPRPFYVGKGNKHRIRNPERNDKHRYVKKTYGYRREIVFTSDDEHECFSKEVKLVAEHHTYIHDPLASDIACNFTKGGEGASGAIRSAETKRRQRSAAIIAQNRPEVKALKSAMLKIANATSEIKTIRSEASKRRYENPEERRKQSERVTYQFQDPQRQMKQIEACNTQQARQNNSEA